MGSNWPNCAAESGDQEYEQAWAQGYAMNADQAVTMRCK